MATQSQVQAYIKKVAPIIQKYAKDYGYKVCSPIIAQACIESAYGESLLASKYHNHFGMKCGSGWQGRSVNMATKEEYRVGTITNIKANFRVYDNLELGIRGYFEFIKYARYSKLKGATTPREYLTLIKDAGYATSSTYVNTNMQIVDKYNLTQYDGKQSQAIAPTNITDIAKEVILGKWGNGEARKQALTKAGYNYTEVQKEVNRLL